MAARIFVDSTAVDGRQVRIDGAGAQHLATSLRARPGELLVVIEAGATEHGVLLQEVRRESVTGEIVWSRAATGEPELRVHVLQAVPQRGMDEAVESLAELGAASIRPLITSRTVRRFDAAAAQRRVEHWQAVGHEAAQVAGRARPPEIHAPASVEQACAALPGDTRILAATPHAERAL